MFSFINLNQTFDYTLKNDTDPKTIFKLGVIPGDAFALITEQDGAAKVNIVYKILQLGLKGWDNSNKQFETVSENIFGQNIQVVPMSTLREMPLNVVTELSTKIMEINQLTEGERKN